MFDVFLHAHEKDMPCLLHIQYMAGLLPGIFWSKSDGGEHSRKTVDFLTTLERATFTGFSSSSSSFSLGFLLSLGWSFLLFIRLFVAVAAPLKCLDLQCILIVAMEMCTLKYKSLLNFQMQFLWRTFRPLHQASGASPPARTSHWMENT